MKFQLLSALAATVALGSVTVAPNAQAETLLFSYVESGQGAIDFSFDQNSVPVPLSYSLGSITATSVFNWQGNVGPYSSIYWYSAADFGQFDTADGSYEVFGPQVYSGPESNPVFAPGVFSAADQTNGLDGTLTVTAVGVPEPAAWAMMLLGFGGLGAATRVQRRRQALTAA